MTLCDCCSFCEEHCRCCHGCDSNGEFEPVESEKKCSECKEYDETKEWGDATSEMVFMAIMTHDFLGHRSKCHLTATGFGAWDCIERIGFPGTRDKDYFRWDKKGMACPPCMELLKDFA
jgi:hypothetical protein